MADAILKRCCTCKECKPFDQFPKNRSEKDGLKKRCKACNNRANKEYRERNPESSAASSRNWVLKNPAKAEAKKQRWKDNNPGRHTELARLWRQRNSERHAESMQRYTSRPDVRIQRTIRERIRQMVKGRKSRRTFDLLGYTVDDLKVHLERQFTKGMRWENFGDWHIDHVVPLSSFNITSEFDPELQAAWALSNLRPLWATENLQKRAKRIYLV